MLAANLKAVDLSIEGMIADFGMPGFVPPEGSSNNPWQALDPDGEALIQHPSAGLGFGIPLQAKSAEDALALLKRFRRMARETGRPDIARIIGIDLLGTKMETNGAAQHWCAGDGLGRHFGSRRQANRLMNADALCDHALTGKNVKVFVIDQGINRDYLRHLGGTYGGGMFWTPSGTLQQPGQAQNPYGSIARDHGSMLLRSLVDQAPDAVYYDLPLLPTRIAEVENFALRALFAYAFLNYFFLSSKGPWVLLNAWGIVNRFSEALRGYYTNDPDHYLNSLIAWTGRRHDVIFAAGNSGQFCGDIRSTGYDKGPGRSIWGANGLEDVTCVGAVRADAVWVGAASQGPGPDGFDQGSGPPQKPDIAAPSWFVENNDAHLRSGGTSSSSAVVAGAIAALRQNWNQTDVPPVDMRASLCRAARPVGVNGWTARAGHGAIDLAATISQLP